MQTIRQALREEFDFCKKHNRGHYSNRWQTLANYGLHYGFDITLNDADRLRAEQDALKKKTLALIKADARYQEIEAIYQEAKNDLFTKFGDKYSQLRPEIQQFSLALSREREELIYNIFGWWVN